MQQCIAFVSLGNFLDFITFDLSDLSLQSLLVPLFSLYLSLACYASSFCSVRLKLQNPKQVLCHKSQRRSSALTWAADSKNKLSNLIFIEDLFNFKNVKNVCFEASQGPLTQYPSGPVQLQAEALQLLINSYPKPSSCVERSDVMDF